MKTSYSILLLLLFVSFFVFVYSENKTCLSSELKEEKTDVNQVLSRRKRYVVFPKGSSLQLVYCNTYLFRPVVDIFRFGTTIGLAWQLPDDPAIFHQHKKKHKIYKREAFKKMTSFITHNGNDGHQCVLKALCESGQRTPSKKDFLTEILYTIFSINDDYDDENDDVTHEEKMYKKAHNSVNQNCETLYPNCTISIFNSLKQY